MSKFSDHPIFVLAGFLAAMFGIATYVEQKWTLNNKEPSLVVPHQKNEEWWLIDVDGKKPKLVASFVDRGSIIERNGQYSAWTMVVLQTPQLDDAVSLKAHGYYDCAGNTSRHTMYVKRFKDRTSDVSDYPEAKFKPEAPNSMGQRALNFICFGQREGSWRLPKNDPYAAMAQLIIDPLFK